MGMGVSGSAGGGRRRRRGGRSSAMSEINITPMVDVVLVLLIIFMVVTPLLQKNKDVVLPRADNIDLRTKEEDPLTISICASGTRWFRFRWRKTERHSRSKRRMAPTRSLPTG